LDLIFFLKKKDVGDKVIGFDRRNFCCTF